MVPRSVRAGQDWRVRGPSWKARRAAGPVYLHPPHCVPSLRYTVTLEMASQW